jgi:hypothetical protein
MLIRRHRYQPREPWKWPEDKPKPKLPAIHLPHFRVHYADLEKYLETVYKMRDFSFFRATGFAPGLIPEYAVTGELPPAWESKNKAERIRHGQRTSDMLLILNVLCLDGFIPAGRYMVDTKPRRPAIDVYQALLEKHRDPQARECVQFRERHRGNPGFVKRAAVLDNAVSDWLRKQQ